MMKLFIQPKIDTKSVRIRIPDLDYCVMIITFVVWRKNARDNFGLMMQCVAYHDQDEYLLLHIWKLNDI